MKFLKRLRLIRLLKLFSEPPRDPRAQAARIDFMEENVFLPVKAFVIFLLFSFIYGSGTFDPPSPNIVPRTTQLEIEQARVDMEETVKLKEETERKNASIKRVKGYFWIYLTLSSAGAFFLIFMGRFNLNFIQWLVVFINLIDAIFLTAWTFETGALKDSLYWIFLGLIIRNAVSVPIPAMQISLNLCLVGCFAFAGIWDWAYVDAGLQGSGGELIPVEAFTVRLVLMALLMVCCYGVQTIFDNQRQAREDKEDFAARQQQLESAGRLAAEVAHQIKNPLSIITNSLFTLERNMKKEDPAKSQPSRQLEIIREEVDRADRIITELMGYAQLAEGRVENLDVNDEIERAIEQVFPPGSDFETAVELNIEPDLPALKMQRGHLNEILVNILKNSRDVQNGDARIHIQAHQGDNDQVTITIDDNGPGILPKRVEQVFEPYFTTKDSGSGLGLSIVKHNTEIYGGHVRVASGSLKGARIEIELPTRTLMRLRS
jgi:signal transduction histidine kinase